jgi:hypothetical protein
VKKRPLTEEGVREWWADQHGKRGGQVPYNEFKGLSVGLCYYFTSNYTIRLIPERISYTLEEVCQMVKFAKLITKVCDLKGFETDDLRVKGVVE